MHLLKLIGCLGTSCWVAVQPYICYKFSMLFLKDSGVKGCFLGICYTWKARCLVPPNSVLVIFNMPFLELVAPICLIYLCQENVVVFLLQYLLNQFKVCVILYPPFGKCRVDFYIHNRSRSGA